MTIKPSIIFVLFFALIVWPASYLVFKGRSPEFRKVADIVETDAFLSTLQNQAPDGCIAATYMDRVDVMVVGNSLAYANIDPLVLSQQFPGQSVAICALSGWNTEFFEPFFDFLRKRHIAPSRLIWIADESSRNRFTIYQQRLDAARETFLEEGERQRLANLWLETFESPDAFDAQMQVYEERLTFHAAEIERVSVGRVTDIVSSRETEIERFLMQLTESTVPIPDNEKTLRELCTNIFHRGMSLDIVFAPMPTTHDGTFAETDIYGSDNLKAQVGYYEQHAPCARRIILDDLDRWGLDNRHFLNRRLDADYPYTMWDNLDAFDAAYAEMTSREKLALFDPTHLNGVGAAIFTENMARRLR